MTYGQRPARTFWKRSNAGLPVRSRAMELLYPYEIETPGGYEIWVRRCSQFLRGIKEDLDAEYFGWDLAPVTGHRILADFRKGLHLRINIRGAVGGMSGGKIA